MDISSHEASPVDAVVEAAATALAISTLGDTVAI
jgi:hypothetical protein